MKETIVFLKGPIIEKAALTLFLLSIPFSIRKVFTVFYPTEERVFNEYTDISLYLSDVFLGVFLLILILRNKSTVLSISSWKRMFHVEHLLPLLFLPLLFIGWAGISIFWSESKILAGYTVWKLLEGYALYTSLIFLNVPRGTFLNPSAEPSNSQMFHVEHSEQSIYQTPDSSQNVPRGTFLNTISEYFSRYLQKCSTWNILKTVFLGFIISGSIQALIGLAQFIHQASLGLVFFKESVFSGVDGGVAKVVIGENTLVRAYGLLPHPNVLAAFLGVTLLISLAYPLLFKGKMFHVEHFRWIYRLAIGIQFTVFLLTFSKSAWLGLFVASFFLFYRMFHVEHFTHIKLNVPRGTFLEKIKGQLVESNQAQKVMGLFQMFHVEHFFFILVVWIVTYFLIKGLNWYYFIVQPFQERLFLQAALDQILSTQLFQGVGIGQFVLNLPHFLSVKLEAWQFQPIHNLFLLITAEMGLIGLGLFLTFIGYLAYQVFKNVPRGTIGTLENNKSKLQKMFHVEHSSEISQNVPRGTFSPHFVIQQVLTSCFLFLLIVAFFDHYLWDIQQGQLLFWLVCGLLVRTLVHQKEY